MSPRHALVTGVGGPAGEGLAALCERGFAVIGADMEPVAIPGIPTVRLPAELVMAAALAQVGAGPAGLVVGPAEAVLTASDKLLTCRALESAGIGVPRFVLPSEVGSVARAIGLPWLSKPRIGRGGRGVVVHSFDDKAGLAGLDDAVILQEFIPGAEYVANLFLAEDPDDDVAIVLEKTALTHGEVGNATAVRRADAPDVAEIATRAARVIGLTGPANLDVRRRADGTAVVLEINARFGAHCPHVPEVLDALLAEHYTDAPSVQPA